jgi:hypothetical protein
VVKDFALRATWLFGSALGALVLVQGCDSGVNGALDAGRDATSDLDALALDALALDALALDALVLDAPALDAPALDAGSDAALSDAFVDIDACAPRTFYVDDDGDGFGDPARTLVSCEDRVAGHSLDGTDCDDACTTCRPGGTETCDGRDNDCAGGVDDGVLLTFYRDCDGDGLTVASPMTTQACAPPSTRPSGCATGVWRTSASPVDMADCVDTNALVFPGQDGYFTSPIAGVPAASAFDYDCDTIEERGLTAMGACPPVTSGDTCGMAGWEASTPGCGASATWVECRRGTSTGLPDQYFCVRSTRDRVQGCR